MDVKSDILGTGRPKTAPEQQAGLKSPMPAPVSASKESSKEVTLQPITAEQESRLNQSLQAPSSPSQVVQRGQAEKRDASNQRLEVPEEVKPKRFSYAEMFSMLNPRAEMTPEEQEKEKKRDRSRRIISAIGDGISALSNLYFTTQGAPNAYTGQNTLSAAYQRRHDTLNARRNAERDKWMTGYLNALQMDDNMGWRDKMQAYREGRDKLGDERYEDNQKAASAAADLKYQREITMQKINHAFQMGMLDLRSKNDLEKQAVGAKNQKELLALGHKYKLEEIAAGKKDPTKKTTKKTNYPKMRFEGPNGETKYYDMNEDTQVAKMYNEGVRAGYFKEIDGKQPTVKQMRDKIIGSNGRWKEGNSAKLNEEDGAGAGWSLNENDGAGGWSLK